MEASGSASGGVAGEAYAFGGPEGSRRCHSREPCPYCSPLALLDGYGPASPGQAAGLRRFLRRGDKTALAAVEVGFVQDWLTPPPSPPPKMLRSRKEGRGGGEN